MTTLTAERFAEPRLTDDDLVARLRNGDAGALELLMRRHNQRLYRLARSVLRNPSDAEEAVQDGYVQAYERLGDYRGPNGFAAWLGRIVLNKSYDRVRDRGKVVSLDSVLRRPLSNSEGEDPVPMVSDQFASGLPDPERLAASDELRRLIEAAIDDLPDEYRTVFVLRAVEGFSVEETGNYLDIPLATVRTRYHRARRRMREFLGGSLEKVLPAAFSFAGERCDRIVGNVIRRVRLRSGP